MSVGVEPAAAQHHPAFVASAAGGEWLRPPTRGCAAVRTDTRDIRPGDAFCALPGAHADGHRFVADAAERGAPFAIITDELPTDHALPEGFGLLRVRDGRRALRDWARAHRERVTRTRVVSVSGSAGKTTTVRLAHAACSPLGRGTHAPRSFNNELGVAMTLIAASLDDDYLVCEIGTSAPGETADLASLVRPHVALVVSLGREHMEHFGTLECVAHETVRVADHLEPRGTLVLPAGEPLLQPPAANRVRTFGPHADADTRVERIEQTWEGLHATIAGVRCRIPMVGAHNAANAAGAVAAAHALGVDPARAAAALERANPAPMRLERVEHAGVRVLHDAYNAHPDSVAVALDTLAAIDPGPGGRRVAVLGPMLELGPLSDAAHAEAGRRARGVCDLLIALGTPAARAASAFGPGAVALGEGDRPSDAACAEAAGLLRPGDVVLVKASRGAALERVVAELAARGQG